MPANVTEVIIYDRRWCDLCAHEAPNDPPLPAEYDAKTKWGPWASRTTSTSAPSPTSAV